MHNFKTNSVVQIDNETIGKVKTVKEAKNKVGSVGKSTNNFARNLIWYWKLFAQNIVVFPPKPGQPKNTAVIERRFLSSIATTNRHFLDTILCSSVMEQRNNCNPFLLSPLSFHRSTSKIIACIVRTRQYQNENVPKTYTYQQTIN